MRSLLYAIGFALASIPIMEAGESFRIYSPSSKNQTLWIVDAIAEGEHGLSLSVREKVDLGFPARVLTAHPDKPLVYLSAAKGDSGASPGAVVTLSDDGGYQKHRPVVLNDGACFLSLDQRQRFLLSVSYGNGRLNVYPLNDEGTPGKAVTTIDAGKREAHCVLPSPDNAFLYIPYVKSNLALLQYRFDDATGAVSPLDPFDAKPPVGTGPRHMAYHPTLPMVYFSNEQGVGLSSYARGKNGQLELRQDLKILPEGMSTEGLSASDLKMTADGKFLFAGLRGHRQEFDKISRYRIAEDGLAEFIGFTEADKIPWGLAISPQGRYLLVSATKGASLTAYRISQEGDLEKIASLPWESDMSHLLAR